MRVLFSIAALLVVLFVVMQLAGRQLDALRPGAGQTPVEGPMPQTGSGSGDGSPGATAAAEAGRRIGEALQQGAARRASDAAP
jgi:hypothetical protein